MSVKYSEQLNNVFTYSTQEAERLGNAYVGPEHLLLGIFREGNNRAVTVLMEMKVDVGNVKQKIEALVRTDKQPAGGEIPLLKSTEKIKKIMELEARSMSAEAADTEHLLLAILKDKNNLAVDVLNSEKLTYEKFLAHLSPINPADIQMSSNQQSDDEDEDEDDSDEGNAIRAGEQSPDNFYSFDHRNFFF